MALRTFDRKRTFITGAASGIGRATAIAAAREGAELFLTDLDPDGLAETVETVRAAGGTVSTAKAFDITDFAAVRAYAAEIHEAHGSMDVVMNVAGISIWGTIETLEHQHWRNLVEVNLMGPVHVMECLVPAMIRAGRGGELVNVSSAAGLFGLPWHAAYSATKFGVRGISEVLRLDLRKHGIGVTLLCPGAVHTPLTETATIAGVDRDDPVVRKAVRRFQRRGVTPEAAAAALIAGVKSRRHVAFTSNDIRFGHWVQRKFSPPYDLVMRLLSKQVERLASTAPRSAGSYAEPMTSSSPRLESVAPVLPVTDLARSVEHYRTLGFEVTDHAETAGIYAIARRGTVSLHLALTPELDPRTGAGCAYVYVDDADALAAEWSDRTPTDTTYGLREGAHIDPDNNLLRYGSPLAS